MTTRNRNKAPAIDVAVRQVAYPEVLMDALHLGVVYQDAAGHITLANAAAERILGLSVDQMRGLTSADPHWRAVRDDGTPFPGSEHPAMVALETGEAVLDVKMGVHDTHGADYRWINIRAFPVLAPPSPKALGVCAIFEDITDQRQLTLSQAASAPQFQLLFEAMSEGMALHQVVCDSHGEATDYRILDVNPAFQAQTGMRHDDVVGKLATQAYGVATAPFLDIYGRVAQTQQPIKFEQYFEPLQRHFLIQVFSPTKGQFATVFTDITERLLLEQTLRDSKTLITSVVDSLNEHVAVIDARGFIISVNASWVNFARANGCTQDSLVSLGANYLDVCADACAAPEEPDGAHAMNGILSVLTGAARDFTMEYPCHSPAQERWFELHVVPLLGSSGGAVLIHQNITDRKRAEEALRNSEDAYHRQFVDNSVVMLLIDQQDGHIIDANIAAQNFYGYTLAQLQALKIFDINTLPASESERMMRKVVADQGGTFEFQHRLASGAVRDVEVSVSQMRFHGRNILHSIIHDITERKTAAQRIEHLAFYDALTQLPNRRLMLDRLNQALVSSARRGRHGAVLMIDLDNFKILNDTLGHDVGDQLLVAVAQRLQSCVRVGDTVSRLGGDEFVVLLEELADRDHAVLQAEQVAEKILIQLAQSFTLTLAQSDPTTAQVSHQCSGSIGIALFRGLAASADELLKRADTAMYQAKAAGRNALRFFDPRMQTAVATRAKLESDLRRAIQNDEFVVHYQPQVNHAGRIVGAESLVRWQHPERGLLPPGQFISVAEETGLILPIGEWVLCSACAQLAAWSRQQAFAHLTLAVNVSANQCRSPAFAHQVLQVLRDTGARPEQLELELTESLLLENKEDIIAKMRTLKAEGIRFSLDDFGTGYSSLAYLKRLPLDQLKIDKSFIDDVLTDPNDAAIAKTVVALSQNLGLSVIAEGVETLGQRDFLAHAGCNLYQGFLFSPALPLAEFSALIHAQAAAF